MIDSGSDPDLPEGWVGAESGILVELPASADESAAPDLETIVSKLTPSNRELLDELFRAKFVGVRKIKPDELH